MTGSAIVEYLQRGGFARLDVHMHPYRPDALTCCVLRIPDHLPPLFIGFGGGHVGLERDRPVRRSRCRWSLQP